MENDSKKLTIEEKISGLDDKKKILAAAYRVLEGKQRTGSIPDKWDGHAAERIVEWLVQGGKVV